VSSKIKKKERHRMLFMASSKKEEMAMLKDIY
jgi:hypothetical protein